MALTFQGRKGLPVVSRVSLLDSKFLEYQNAVIGIVQTTLNARKFFVTLFPNFNMSLKDPHLCDALKVHVQITGASQVQDTFAATPTTSLLIVYRIMLSTWRSRIWLNLMMPY